MAVLRAMKTTAPDMAARLLDALREWRTRAGVCEAAKVSPRTASHWLSRWAALGVVEQRTGPAGKSGPAPQEFRGAVFALLDRRHDELSRVRELAYADEDRGPPEFGCCLPPGECCMPGLHFPSECHTAADYERQHGADGREPPNGLLNGG